jgi:predicted dehydrogenase
LRVECQATFRFWYLGFGHSAAPLCPHADRWYFAAMYNFAFVGCGNMANWHAEELLKVGNVKIVALVDPTPPHAENFRRKHAPDAILYESLQTLLEKPPEGGLDAVVIVTPHTLHYSQAKIALEHGVNVLVEKPMVTSTPDAYDLWRTVRQSGKLLGITFQSPYTQHFGYLAKARDEGTLGRFQAVNGWISQGWLGLTTNTWRQDPALSGGGFMYDTGAHLLNAIMWLMNDPVIEVGCFFDHLNSPVDILGTAVMKFQSGAMGSVTFAGNTPRFDNELKIFTDRYTIHTDAYGKTLRIIGKDDTTLNLDIPPGTPGTPHANFVAALEGKEPLRAPVRYGVLLSALMDAMYESGQSGNMVKVKAVPADPPS